MCKLQGWGRMAGRGYGFLGLYRKICFFFPTVCSFQLVCITSSGLQGLFISTTCKQFSSVQIFPQNALFSFLYIQITQPSILSGLGCTGAAASVAISQISSVLVSFPGGSLIVQIHDLE